MRRWFSRFSSSSSANTSRVTSPTPCDQLHVTQSISADHLTLEYDPLSLLPSPSSPSLILNNSLWNADFASDPSSWEKLFMSHWEQVEEIVESEGEITYEKVNIFQYFYLFNFYLI